MIELTQEQIEAGWIAIPDDCMEMPAELEGTVGNDFGMIFADGDIRPVNEHPASFYRWDEESPQSIYRVVAYRILKPHPGTTASPNEAMLARDLPRTYDVDALAGNGMIFGTPKVEKCNLLTVAEISTTGFSLWGAEHD